MRTPLIYLARHALEHYDEVPREQNRPRRAAMLHAHPRSYRTNPRRVPWPWRDAIPDAEAP